MQQQMPITEAVKKVFRSVVILDENPLKVATTNKNAETLDSLGATFKGFYQKGQAKWIMLEIPESAFDAIQELAAQPGRKSNSGIKAIARKGRDIMRFSPDNLEGDIIGEIMPMDDVFSSVIVKLDEGEFYGMIEKMPYADVYPEGTASKDYAYVLVIEGKRIKNDDGIYMPRGGGFNAFSSSLVNWLQNRDDEAEAESNADHDEDDD